MTGMLHIIPREVRAMSFAEVAAAIDGFTEFNSKSEPDVPTMEEVEEMMRLYPDA